MKTSIFASPVIPVSLPVVRGGFLSALRWNCFLCWDCESGDMPSTLDAALLCSSRAGSDLGLESGLVEIIMAKVPYKRSCPKRDSNLGPNHLSLLEFETWQLRPLGHHGRFVSY